MSLFGMSISSLVVSFSLEGSNGCLVSAEKFARFSMPPCLMTPVL